MILEIEARGGQGAGQVMKNQILTDVLMIGTETDEAADV
jgi:hypothetical protein